MNSNRKCSSTYTKKNWSNGLRIKKVDEHAKSNEKTVEALLTFAKSYNKRLEEEDTKTPEELAVSTVGKIDPKKHLEASVEELMTHNIAQTLTTMIDAIIF